MRRLCSKALVGREQGGVFPAQEGVGLLRWGDPYLTAWLEAIQGEPLSEEDYREAGWEPGANACERCSR